MLIRVAEVYIGDAAGNFKTIVSSGGVNDIRVVFNANLTRSKVLNEITLELTNLSEASRNQLHAAQLVGGNKKDFRTVTINAGYRDTGLSLVGEGQVLAATTSPATPDIVTQIILRDGFFASAASRASKTFNPGDAINKVVSEIANEMDEVTVGEIDLKDDSLGTGGLTLSGASTQELTKLGRRYNFNWWIDAGVLHAVSNEKESGNVYSLNWRDGTLREIKPILVSALQINQGVEIIGELNPAIRPNDMVQVESRTDASLNGRYRIRHHDMHGDTHGGDWQSIYRTERMA